MNMTTVSVGLLGTNCYILSSNKNNCAVIDPGAQSEKILARIAEEKLDVKYILLTHGHHDHIGAVKKVLEKFPEAKLYIGKNDLEMLTDGSKSLASIRYNKSGEYFIECAETVSDGDEVTLDELNVRVVESPGHTKGGVCYICQDMLFSGDTLFYGDVGRCDLYGSNYDSMLATLRKLSALNGDYHVYPGHGESTSLEYERQHNSYIAEAMQ